MTNITIWKMKFLVEKEVFTWKDEVVYNLINLWQQEPALYNVKHDDYDDKQGTAFERIHEHKPAREFYPLPSRAQIVEKMNSLRTYYNTQQIAE